MRKVQRGNKSIQEMLPVIVAVVLVLGVIIALAVMVVMANSKPKNDVVYTPRTENKPVVAKDESTKKVTISAMGDMIPHDTITNNARIGNGYDYTKYFAKISPIYKGSDVVFCNQEGLSAGEQFGISGYPTFNAPTKFAADLQTAGCNVVNLANNHIGDKGQEPIDATVAQWEKLKPLAYAGANRTTEEQRKVRYFEKNGLKFAFLAFADFSNNKEVSNYGLNVYHDETLVKTLAEEARKNADVVLVSMHWGDEDSQEVNQDQQAQVQKLASYGVDVIVGTGPHVLQKAEFVDRPDGSKMLVWYSLGNMLSSQLELNQLTGGVAQMTIQKSGDKVTIDKPTFTPTYMSYEWTAAEQAAGSISARKNPMIYPLADASEVLTAMRMGATPDSIKQSVQQTLGDTVEVK